MVVRPTSFLSRLLGAAWTILVIAVLLWLAARLLADVWVWVVGVAVLTLLIRILVWFRQWRREQW